jgi:hypothetical protein
VSTSEVLLDDACAPLTSVIGFLRTPTDDVALALRRWREQLHGAADVTEIDGPLRDQLGHLAPLVITSELVIGTQGVWTAVFDNTFTGGGLVPTISRLAQELGTSGVVVVSIPGDRRPHRKRWAARPLEIYGPERTEFLNNVRTLSLVEGGGRRRFDANGTVQPFEDVEQYTQRRTTERFTDRMLVYYCAALGLRPFDEEFYVGRDHVVGAQARTAEQFSLRDAQGRLGIGVDGR